MTGRSRHPDGAGREGGREAGRKGEGGERKGNMEERENGNNALKRIPQRKGDNVKKIRNNEIFPRLRFSEMTDLSRSNPTESRNNRREQKIPSFNFLADRFIRDVLFNRTASHIL